MWLILILVAIVALVLLKQSGVFRKVVAHSSEESGVPIVDADRWREITQALERSAIPALRIRLTNRSPKTKTESKFGGAPYWPSGKEYPVNDRGIPLTFIAQINFDELDESLEDYPETGLLQFYIDVDDEEHLMGLTFFSDANELNELLSNGTMKYAVIYHRETTAGSVSIAVEHDTQVLGRDTSPITGEAAIELTPVLDLASPWDYRFQSAVSAIGPLTDAESEYVEITQEKLSKHKLGGYASFTQGDPREQIAPDDDWLLLFQMDSDSNRKIDIMWGDVGIANFFIKRSDLKNLDFSQVWYNWDCS